MVKHDAVNILKHSYSVFSNVAVMDFKKDTFI